MARIWHLERTGVDVGYDETAAVVVVADTEDEARSLASDRAGVEGAAVWKAPTLCRCQSIGSANRSVTPGVVCQDYRAG